MVGGRMTNRLGVTGEGSFNVVTPGASLIGLTGHIHAASDEFFDNLAGRDRRTNKACRGSSFQRKDRGKVPRDERIINRDWAEGLVCSEEISDSIDIGLIPL
jgi:hypothetical protein